MSKSEAKSGEAPELTFSPEQARLIQEKAEVLGKARALQVELAGVRAKLTRLDQEMLAANFRLPLLASW